MMVLRFFMIILMGISCSNVNLSKKDFDSQYKALNELKAPGMQMMIKKDGHVIRSSSFGYADVFREIKINDKTRFRLASNTKAFTGLAALILEEQGLLNPEEKITTYLKDLPVNFSEIKIKHLIHHTADLPDYNVLCKIDSNRIISNKEVLNWLKRQKKNINPGEKYEYSNTGYILLATIIENITGTSFGDFIEEKIFLPLGMTNSFVITPETFSSKSNRAYGYRSRTELHDHNSCNYTNGDDGIYSSIYDLRNLDKVFTTDILLNEKSRKKLLRPVKVKSGKEIFYSYGWQIMETSYGTALSHTGSWTGFRSAIRYYPKNNILIVILSNFSDIPREELLERAEKEAFGF